MIIPRKLLDSVLRVFLPASLFSETYPQVVPQQITRNPYVNPQEMDILFLKKIIVLNCIPYLIFFFVSNIYNF